MDEWIYSADVCKTPPPSPQLPSFLHCAAGEPLIQSEEEEEEEEEEEHGQKFKRQRHYAV